MLHDLDKTLENLLIKEGKLNKTEIDVVFDQPTSEWSARLSRPTLNLWCYDVRENIKLRNMEMQMARNGRGAITSLPPRRMDLTYLVTAWARKIEDEHQLLWRALATLKRFTVLEPDQCEGDLRYQEHDMPVMVADMSDNAVNLVDLWSVLDNQLRLGFILTVTVELDVTQTFESPLVFETIVRVGETLDPEGEEIDDRMKHYLEIRHTADEEGREAFDKDKITRTYDNLHEVKQPDSEEDE